MQRTPEGQAFRFYLRDKGWETDDSLEADIFGGGTQEDIMRHVQVFNYAGEFSLEDNEFESLNLILATLWLDGWLVWHCLGERFMGKSVLYGGGTPEKAQEVIDYVLNPKNWSASKFREIEDINMQIMMARHAARKAHGIREPAPVRVPVHPKFQPAAKPQPKPQPQAKPKPQPQAKPKVAAKPKAKPAAKPKKQPQAKPTSRLAPKATPRPAAKPKKPAKPKTKMEIIMEEFDKDLRRAEATRLKQGILDRPDLIMFYLALAGAAAGIWALW
jgi:hypothetical protein